MELIFMRHGEAEEAVFGMEDATRNLTEKRETDYQESGKRASSISATKNKYSNLVQPLSQSTTDG